MKDWWTTTKTRFQTLLEEYGPIALGTYLVMALIVYVAFVVAIRQGFAPSGAAGETGVLVAAWVALKGTQIVRIPATLALTPVVARVVRREAPEPEPVPETVADRD